MTKSSRIPDHHNVFRATIYPLAFKSNNKFNQHKAFKLESQEDGSILGSLAWERYVPTTKHVHRYGCRLAFGMNRKYREQGNRKDRRIYCGSYNLKVGAIRGLVNELREVVLSADVIHHIENGQIAHADLRILVGKDHHGDEGTKTAILDRLWNSCRGPIKHECEGDQDVGQHPNKNLEPPPQGEYRDTRSMLCRVWHITRYQVSHYIWLIFGKII